MRILIAGVGNILHGDDGFGVEVARRLADRCLPDGVDLIETGIAGIALVQELQSGYDALIVIDAVDHRRPPGTVMVIEPEIIDLTLLSATQKHDLLADMHLATPERALMLANALGVLPERRFLIGCQPDEIEVLRIGLSEIVTASVGVALNETDRLLAELLAP